MILTDELANAIVERAMEIIHHNVNVISNDGIIVASGDKSRIGELHEIGLEVARQGRPISIYDEDITPQTVKKAHYAPGINTPIIVNDKVIFVVGVSGNPHEISRYAALAVLTAELLARQAIKNREINWSMRFDDMMMMRCLADGDDLEPDIVQHLSSLYDLSGPRIPYLVRISAPDDGISRFASGSCMQEILRHLVLDLDSSKVCLLEPNQMFMLTPRTSGAMPYQREMQEICARRGMKMTVVKGFEAHDFTSLVKSLRFARFCLGSAKSFFDCSKAADVISTVMCSRQYNYFLEFIRTKLSRSKLSAELRQTINVYMQENLELLHTAQALNIHRNTLKNRFKIITELTGLNPDSEEDLILLHLAFHVDAPSGGSSGGLV